MKRLATFLILSLLTGCGTYTPKTIPDTLLKPTKQYSGNLGIVNVTVRENVKITVYPFHTPIPTDDPNISGKPVSTGPVGIEIRTYLKDAVTNSLEAYNLFDKIGPIRYLMTAIIERYEIFGMMRGTERAMSVQFELINLKNGKIVFSDSINSHIRYRSFEGGRKLLTKTEEKLILDIVTQLINSLHNNLKDKKIIR